MKRHAERDVMDMHAAILREHARPREGHEPLPILAVIGFAALLMWGGWYLGANSHHFDRERFDLAASIQPVSTEPEDPSLIGARLYSSCQGCHQGDGSGVAGAFPPLANSEWVLGDARVMAEIVVWGLEGPIEVSGSRFNGAMPAWGQRFDDAQLAALLTHVRSSFGNDADPVSAELIADVRANRRDTPWTADTLSALQLDED